MLCRLLVGAVVVFGAGVATAAPPGLQPGRHPEGREPDPVARDHFLTDAPVAPAGPGESGAEPGDAPGALWAFVTATHAAVLDTLTIPLGTARAEAM